MRSAALHRFVAGIAAAALLGSGSAQALLHRCGPEAMKSCCCEKGDPAAQQPARLQASDPACCSVSTAPARSDDAAPQATVAQSAPVLVPVVFAALPAAPQLAAASSFGLTRPRSAGPPILRTTCSLLI